MIISISLCGVIPAQAADQAANSGDLLFKKDSMSVKTASGEVPFNIEIAQTPEQLEHGLMFRKSLPADYAMLFCFGSDEPHAMWMKNTLVPLDMLFVDRDGKIVYIQENAKPQSLKHIESPTPVASRAVIEMPAGTVAAKHIQTGDTIIHPYFMH